MIKKTRQIPIKALKLEALLRRMNATHPQRRIIEEELAKTKAGYRGECAVDYQLKYVKDLDYHAFLDIRLEGMNSTFFQIDTLLLTQHFIIILEIKNIAGSLLFDQTFNQLIRTFNEEVASFPDPILQSRRQTQQLQLWIAKQNLPPVPIIPFVVISHPTTIINTSRNSENLSNKLIHAAAVSEKIQQVQQKYRTTTLEKKEFNKVSRLLVRKHIDADPDVLNQFQIRLADVRKGVHCPHCEELPLKKVKGGWRCDHCNKNHSKAHIHSLTDYILLCGSSITNRNCREFLEITSTSIASKLLQSLQVPQTGSYRNRSYQLSLKEMQSKVAED